MKNSIQKLAVAFTLTGLILAGSALSLKAKDNTQLTVLSEVKKVNKINVSGNVKLILVQSSEESVKVYNNYFSKNALVQQKNNELRISSFDKETLTVIVYVTNLNEITASNNASVSTYGNLNTLDLAVNLKDNAIANLNTNTISLSTRIHGNANLTLSGSTTDYEATLGSEGKVNLEQFVAQTTKIKSQQVANIVASTLNTTADLFDL